MPSVDIAANPDEQCALTVKETIAPTFWRDETLPFIEARSIQGGRRFAMQNTRMTRSQSVRSRAAAVRISTGESRARGCRRSGCHQPGRCPRLQSDRQSAVVVSHVLCERFWLMDLQHELGFSHNCGFRAFSTTMTTRPDLYAGLNRLYAVCTDEHADHLKSIVRRSPSFRKCSKR